MRRFFRIIFPTLLVLAHSPLVRAQWVQSTGHHTQEISCLAIKGSNIFAGTSGDGIFLSTNNGTSWTAVDIGLTSGVVFALAASGTNLFAATSAGVFLSTNNGTSWNAVNTGLTRITVYALAVSPNGAGGTNLFAGTASGVFRSTNSGTSWTAVNTGLTSGVVLALAVPGTNLFAGTRDGGVFLSTNNGTSWTAVNTGLTNKYVYTLAVSGTNLFAGTYGGGIFLSTNNGTSWTAVNAGLINGWVTSLAVSGTNVFAGTVVGVYRSTDNGTSWTAVNSGLTRSYVRSLAIDGPNVYAGTQGGGVFLSSDNGTSWVCASGADVFEIIPPFAGTGKFRVDASFSFGFELTGHQIGTTETFNERVTMGGGGGFGGSLSLSYVLCSFLELDATGGFQRSTLSPEVSNASGSFSRTMLLGTVVYFYPWDAGYGGTAIVKMGAGIGYYFPGNLDIDDSQVSGGSHGVFSYTRSKGFHLTGEFEYSSASLFSVGIGLKYYATTYNLESAMRNGVPIFTNSIQQDLRQFDGSGIDIFFRVGVYL